jgi:hypothetical protein
MRLKLLDKISKTATQNHAGVIEKGPTPLVLPKTKQEGFMVACLYWSMILTATMKPGGNVSVNVEILFPCAAQIYAVVILNLAVV